MISPDFSRDLKVKKFIFPEGGHIFLRYIIHIVGRVAQAV
jgi:hypothetical protein